MIDVQVTHFLFVQLMLSIVVWVSASLGVYKSLQSLRRRIVSKEDATSSITRTERAQRRVLQVTRSHCLLSDVFPTEKAIVQLIETFRSNSSVDALLVCIGASSLDRLTALREHFEQVIAQMNETQRVFVLPVYPWGHFTTSLNSAVIYAQDKAYSHILFQVRQLIN